MTNQQPPSFQEEYEEEKGKKVAPIHEKVAAVKHNEDIHQRYEYVENIGQGTMGIVSKVKLKKNATIGSAYKSEGILNRVFKTRLSLSTDRRKNDVYYAMKTIHLEGIHFCRKEQLQRLENEILILNRLDHPHIVRLQEVYNIKTHLYIIMDYCDGGNLYSRFPYSEGEAARITYQLLSAVQYLHNHGIVHRDLKFQNIMFETESLDSNIKLIGFGFSTNYVGCESKNHDQMHRGGNIHMKAPEVLLDGVYTPESDLWSVGVIIHMLLSLGEYPFHHPKQEKLLDMILHSEFSSMCDSLHTGSATGRVRVGGQPQKNRNVWEGISNDAKDMIRSLLVVDPNLRLDSVAAIDHKWLQQNRHKLEQKIDKAQHQQQVGDVLYEYSARSSPLKKIALNVIARRSTAQEISGLRKVFEAYDTNNNGILSHDELREGLKKSNFSEDTITEIFESMDINQTGNVTYTEFLAATLAARGTIEEERIAEAFDKIDSDNTGYISKENLKKFLGDTVNDDFIDEMMNEIDLNNDGRISYKELKAEFRSDGKGSQQSRRSKTNG